MAPKANALKPPQDLPYLNGRQVEELRAWIHLKLARAGMDRFKALDQATEITAQFPMRLARRGRG